MSAIVGRSWLGCVLAASIAGLSIRAVMAQETTPSTDEADAAVAAAAVIEPVKTYQPPAHLLVLRLPAANIAAQIDRQIDFLTPVRDVILGTPVTGVARIVGRPQVKLEPSPDCARFKVVFSGTVGSRTVGRSDPAIVHSHSVTHFTATQEVVFEPGKGFFAKEPTLQATTQCFTDRIESTRGGLIGRIVQRRAADEVASKKGTITAIVRQRAMGRIAAAFERHMEERLAKLNKAVEFQIALADLRTREGNRRLRASTTATHLELADVIGNNEAAIELPILASKPGYAPVEIWVHGSVVPPEVGAALETIFTNPDQSAVVNGLAAMPGTLGKKAASVITALVSDNKVGVQNNGDWLLIQLNTRDERRVAAAPVARAPATRAPVARAPVATARR